MDRIGELMQTLKQQGQQQELLGLLNVLIGRSISLADGTLVSSGLTWREAAAALKKARWNKNAIAELGLKASDLPPRDRLRFWYSAIARSGVDSPEAVKAGDKLAKRLKKLGYVVGPAPAPHE